MIVDERIDEVDNKMQQETNLNQQDHEDTDGEIRLLGSDTELTDVKSERVYYEQKSLEESDQDGWSGFDASVEVISKAESFKLMPKPTEITNVEPTSLLPSDSELSSLSVMSSSSSSSSRLGMPAPSQVFHGGKMSGDNDQKTAHRCLELKTKEDDYVTLDEEDEVETVCSACSRTVWCQIFTSRFFIFLLCMFPLVILPMIFVPFYLFQVDQIFLFILCLCPFIFIFLVMNPKHDTFFLDGIEMNFESDDEEEDELMKEFDFKDYSPTKVYSF